MRVTHLSLRDFRCYASAEVGIGPGITVVHGRNGAGKTNLLDALYLCCTGRSSRTASDRELIRFGARVARTELHGEARDGAHRLSVGLEVGERRRMRCDGQAVARMVDLPARPLACVFLPDRLELVKGAPAVRRNHLDQVVAALWPSRTAARQAYAQALAQRNALLHRARTGAVGRDSLAAWDAELARHGVDVMANRGEAVAQLESRFTRLANELGLDGEATISYRPRSQATTPDGLVAELAERVDSDLERGFTQHGPHRDDVVMRRGGRELRAYGSQGEQRLALLALLMAEREALAEVRDETPMMLLDDVMSELDPERRARLVEILRAGGQSVITTTDLAHVPGADRPDVARVAIAGGAVLGEAVAA